MSICGETQKLLSECLTVDPKHVAITDRLQSIAHHGAMKRERANNRSLTGAEYRTVVPTLSFTYQE